MAQKPSNVTTLPPAASIPSTSAPANDTNDVSTIIIPVDKKQEELVIDNVRNWQNSLYSQFQFRSELEYVDRIYMRETDWTEDNVKSRIANRIGDARKMRNVTVPVVMPQVNSALTYLCNVFLTGYPIFPISADPSNEDVAMQMETIVQENSITAGWAQQISMFFRDGLKYNLHAIECDWKQRTNWTIGNDPKAPNGAGAKKILWEGNCLKRMDLYNTFWDPRVHPSEMHTEGEFVGYTEIYSRVRFKKFCNSLYNRASKGAVIAALNSQPVQGAIGASLTSPFGYYIPYINPAPFYNKSSSMDWMNWATNTVTKSGGVEYKNAYSVTTVYARVIPADYDFVVPERNTPQVWKFVIVNGQVVLTAERLTNIHNFLPIFFGQPIEDGLDYQTKSYASNVSDMQDIASALWNGTMASKRRLVGDRVLYDPSRIKESDINSVNPAAKIPVRPAAFGKPISDAVYQFPFRDEQTDSFMQSAAAVVQMANLINGQNPAQQGQFVKGNKTRHEYEDVMGHGNGQNQQLALSTEYQVLVPLKEVIKLNIMQYQKAGTIFNIGKGVPVDVKPEDIRKAAIHFKVSDGLIPTDKVTGDDLLQTVIQQISTSQQLSQQFNLADALTYLLKTQGLDMTPFKKSPAQLQYEQQLAAWQQAAAEAAKQGAVFSTPQPQPSPQLQAEMQQKQQGGASQTPEGNALESTQT